MILVLLAGMWVLCLSLLSMSAVTQRSSKIRMDELQAEVALHAGLQEIKQVLLSGVESDGFLIIQEETEASDQAPRLHRVHPEWVSGRLQYVSRPLFSSEQGSVVSSKLSLPETQPKNEAFARLQAHPWFDPIALDWIPLHDERNRQIARYAYWIEDLEGYVDPSLDLEGVHLHAMDASSSPVRANRLLENRQLLVSPESSLVAAGFEAPLERENGRLTDSWADVLERCATVGLRSYEEQPRVPHLHGLSPLVMGQPKLNLNDLLMHDSDEAVRDMASWIRKGLPRFEERQGGFPEDYVETLAANALDYADEDPAPRVQSGRYRSIDGQPFISEVVLHLHFQGLERDEDRWVLKWSLRLFAELWNLCTEPIEGGQARLSYEVNLRPTAVGLGGPGLPFDSPELLDDPDQSSHALERRGSQYLTPVVEISLQPDEYRFHQFAQVDYTIDCVPQLDAAGEPLPEWFDLVELEHEARGLSLVWNGQEVERLARIHRDPHGLANFRTDKRRKTAKACIPGFNYGDYVSRINNPGDPRISHYLRSVAIGENAYPENLSPHRRNIRRRNIYDKDPSPQKTRHYGRVMPSQWPDGGHDSVTGNFRVTTSDARFPTDQEFWPLSDVPSPQASNAPQRLSKHGRFLSVTELGRVYDPLMWTPAYPDHSGQMGSGLHDTKVLLGQISYFQRPAMPESRHQWPEVSWASFPSTAYGGGNSLRIGRPEHGRFDQPGTRASRLLDLFHCGQPENPTEFRGPTIRVEGRVNLNTASHEVLRCLAYGALVEDEAISRIVNRMHDTSHAMGPWLESWQPTVDQLHDLAGEVADGIIRARPFASPSELAEIRNEDGEPLFGNPRLHAPGEDLQWSDAAAEELFARVYGASGVRSRNFRVWLIGQAVSPQGKVTAEVKRVMTLFADPGKREATGELIPQNQKVRVLHVRDF